MVKTIYLFSFVKTPHKFIIAFIIVNFALFNIILRVSKTSWVNVLGRGLLEYEKVCLGENLLIRNKRRLEINITMTIYLVSTTDKAYHKFTINFFKQLFFIQCHCFPFSSFYSFLF